MRAILAPLMLLSITGRSALQAQVDYYGRLGLTVTTSLVRDVIFREIHVRQSLAPTLALGASLPLSPPYRVGLEGSLATSGYHSTEGASETDLGTLRTGSIMLGLNGPVWRRIDWRAGVGLIRYFPAEDQGVFLRGGCTRFLVGGGLDFRPPVLPNWDLMVSVGYDFHRFTTDELRARGFSGTQGVQRISAGIGLARARR